MPYYLKNINFLTIKIEALKLHDPQKYRFTKFYLLQQLLLFRAGQDLAYEFLGQTGPDKFEGQVLPVQNES